MIAEKMLPVDMRKILRIIDGAMQTFNIKSHLPSFVAGVLGGVVSCVLVGTVAFVVIGADDLQSRIREALGITTSVVPVVDSTGEASDVVSVVEAANPAVVSIVISKDVPKMEQYNPFGSFFGMPMMQRQNGTEHIEIGGGSGFIVSSDGYLVTNAHVASDSEADYNVFLNDGTEYAAEVIASDDQLDIAVLKIEGDDLPYLAFGDSDAVKVGQSVVAIGNALGEFRNTVSVGVVSGLSRSVTASSSQGDVEELYDVIQTDAAINPGNSGGPLLDLSGKVIGVNVATSMQGENISFSLPANAVKTTVESVRETGSISRAYLGVRYLQVTESMAEQNSLAVDYGAIVLRGDDGLLAVVPGSPADKAGIEENDIILEVDGEKIDEDSPLAYVLRGKAVGETVELKVLHDGEEKTVQVTLEERPEND